MVKLKSPIALVGVGACVVYGIVLLTEPSPPARVPYSRTQTGSSTTGSAVRSTPARRFARYHSLDRDVFAPGVVTSRPGAGRVAAAKTGPAGNWALTGVSDVNGTPSALVENGSSHETAFLQAGQAWDGMTVVSVEPTAVVLRDEDRHVVRLSFAEEAPEPAAARAGAALAAPPASRGAPTGSAMAQAGGTSLGAQRPGTGSEGR